MNPKNTAIAIGALLVGGSIIYGGFQAHETIQGNRASASAHCLDEANSEYTLANGRSYDCEKVRAGDFSAS